MKKKMAAIFLILLCIYICAEDHIGADDNYFIEYAYKIYYTDFINPGFRFRLTNDIFYLQIPELDERKIEESQFINRVIESKYRTEKVDSFLYLVTPEGKYLLLKNDELFCILINCITNDEFFCLNINSDYVRIDEGNIRRTWIGITDGYSLKTSSSLIEAIGGNKIVYDGSTKYSYQVTDPWIEGKKDYGIGEWIQKRVWRDTQKIVFINGYIDPNKPDLYFMNSRVKQIRVVSDRGEWIFDIDDTPNPQILSLPVSVTGDIRFVIKDVYKGTKYTDTAIGGIYFLYPKP